MSHTQERRRKTFYKPITEYKSITYLPKLTNDKSGFRDWKIRMKNALKQIFRGSEFLKIMEWIETSGTKITGREEIDDIMDLAETEAGIPQHLETYEKIGDALEGMLMHISEDKSESFLMTKRASNGWTAWHRVNKWYMATSGLGMTDRMAAIMKPPQSKKDEDVVYDVERWIDAMSECRALGGSELPYDHKLSALRMIATDGIREKMDFDDAKMSDTMSKEDKYNSQLDTLMRWAHTKSINSRDKGKNKMDLNGMAGGSGWDQQAQWNPEQQQQQDQFLGMMKGKGKGWFSKGGYGKGKGKGKAMKGNCYNCGEQGHPARLCPKGKGGGKGKGGYGMGPYQTGKGQGGWNPGWSPGGKGKGKGQIKGNCFGCGKPGHRQADCRSGGKE